MNGRIALISLIIFPVIISFHYLGWVSGSSQENQSSGRRKLSSQQGFISIDCGIAPGSDYIDAKTGIYYTSDAGFTETGMNFDIAKEHFNAVPNHQLRNVRSFPDGDRNCYTIPVGRGNRYLLRAWFMYGNYDSRNKLPSFTIYLGVDEWARAFILSAIDFHILEIIHVPITDHIDVCLVNTGNGTPFISALELRQLNNSIYSTPSESGSLRTGARLDLGAQQDWNMIRTNNVIISEKDDAYDRTWMQYAVQGWDSVNSSQHVSSSLNESDYKLPEKVMATAATSANESEIHFNLFNMGLDPYRKFYIYMHFAEVMDVEGQIREFTISVNNNQSSFGGPLAPSKDNSETRYNKDSITANATGSLSISLKRTNRSTLPPLLNALEIYILEEDFSLASTQQSDVDAMKTIKSAYAVSKNWQGDPCLPVDYKWHGLNCSNDSSPAIISLNLSSSNLLGNINSSFSHLQSLQSLDLSYNNLTGPVPIFFADMPYLTMLNLMGNNLTGSVPKAVWDKFEDGTLRLGENPNLCPLHSCQGMTEEKDKNFLIPVLVPVLSVIVILIIIIVTLAMIIQKLKMRETKATTMEMATEFPKLEQLKSGNCEFTYVEVMSMTHNFSQVIGRGGFGEVYLGCLAEGTQVAVKVHSKSSVQGTKAFLAEAKLLMRVHHKNLVRLIGYCNDGTNMALIYEYMSNGNLQTMIYGRDTAVLSWKRRVQIVLDAAQGLEYLHNGCKPPILHRDMKSSNILLNETLQAKISDFGMSRYLATESGTLISTTPAGTPGYLDPEFHLTGILNTKSDVYSFGIVLLEVITGRPARKNPGSIHVVVWVSTMIDTGDVQSIVDPRLHGDFSTSSAWKAVETALACVAPTGMERPDMSYVVMELKECLEIEMASRRIPGAGGHSHGSDYLPEGCPLVDSTESVPQAR